MEKWPFTNEEWDAVTIASLEIVNASYREDEDMQKEAFQNLVEILDALMQQHGAHPVLYETKADFTDEPQARVELYKKAIELAKKESIQTATIRISLARVLLEGLGDIEAAKKELCACECEVSDDDLDEWKELLQAATATNNQ